MYKVIDSEDFSLMRVCKNIVQKYASFLCIFEFTKSEIMKEIEVIDITLSLSDFFKVIYIF